MQQFNIPIFLTLFRVILIPCFILTFYLPFHYSSSITTLIFLIAAITDWCDGFLARRWKQTTRFGAFLDPVADKIMICSLLILLTEYFHSWLITLPSVIIIAREIIISALREWMAEIGKRNNIAVSLIGKIKTMIQMLSLIALLWHPDTIIVYIGIISLYIATFLTFWSMFQYIIAAYNYFFC
ncbi:CDP-diacylglycerol--glycerol-3-phosphate 3-phosphatidyltransferase [Pantoea sp. Mhis]|uniref:CDP-diacylglycerol--glycerol-3-phosphate 3-phosphatidyltransferase n=1 Tax=Pantoea sp. Mhis TaxID=2576759 RepID=UPI001356E7AA|nr:CDP-diacylglycerol--glycerol-3-phosphate 3-phosphatidyltransferase [Pantoea sp. Mhis]MXP56148.1 CDP-diacylglycerol--glycerol-3-phosphate 3-phosphatidyltransferase [Pantoea sp. Mhis]